MGLKAGTMSPILERMSSPNVPDTIPGGKILLGYDDFWSVPDDGNRYEILDGEMFVTPLPSLRHQTVSARLHHVLSDYAKRRDLGVVIAAPVGVILGEHRQVQPDLLVIRKENYGLINSKEIVGPPDLVIEILSPTTVRRDRLQKATLYAASKIPYYWIVDPQNETIEEYRLEQDMYILIKKCGGSESIESKAFADLTLSLDTLFDWKDLSKL
jgi:Uma2 family endonuclease